ncbi:MAG: nucleoside deaminase [Sphingobacteriales bacterium]|nr:MAG: nucleoside deaminase [Sphingobacteriales bacterium]
MQANDHHYMRQCLELAQIALAAGDPPVGAVLVLDKTIIGRGIESGRSTGDITRHAEIMAVKDAIRNGYADRLQLSRMYTTHEPCVMCSYLIRHHRISAIMYGAAVPFVGGHTSAFNILSTTDVPTWGPPPMISSGILEDECKALTDRFSQKFRES